MPSIKNKVHIISLGCPADAGQFDLRISVHCVPEIRVSLLAKLAEEREVV
jgi:hypothetical protein